MLDKFSSLRCHECKEKITEEDNVCSHCGANLDKHLSTMEQQIIAEKYFDEAMKTCNSGESLESALINIDLSIQFNPKSADAHNLRGVILDLMEEKDAAILSYQEAIHIDPNYSDATDNLRETKGDKLVKETEHFDTFSSENDEAWTRSVTAIKGVAIFLLTIGGLFLFYKFGLDYILPKNTIVFQPDYSQITTITPTDLEETAEILSERAQALGYANISFIVANKKIITKIPYSIDIEILVERITPIGLLEFVDFGATPIAVGSMIDTDFRNPQKSGEEEWHTVMTNEHFDEAGVTQDQLGGFQIPFSLTDDGTEILAQYTSENIGSYLGIVLDKVVISAPRIQEKITEGQGVISGAFTKESAEDLAATLKTKPLQIPIEVIMDANITE